MSKRTPERPLTCVLVCDFNSANLAGYLQNDDEPPALAAVQSDYGQVMQALGHAGDPIWSDQPEFAFVWTRAETVLPSFARLIEHHEISQAQLLDEVDQFSAAVIAASDRVKALMLATWTLDSFRRGLGMSDLRPDRGLARALMAANLRLLANLDGRANIFALDANRWLAGQGQTASAAKLWYQAKIPYSNGVFENAVADIKAAVRGLRGQARKLLVLDLDDTLWGGIVGDEGWENLRLGGHDPVGEAYQDFQRALKALTRRGIVLGIASKNTEAIALGAINDNPEMVLRASDFAGWRINWQDKAANIADLVSELNLGLQSVVFIDDNPVERARVRDALPEVLVPEWPQNPMLYVSALHGLRCFDTPALSREDAERTRSYVSERQRVDLKKKVGSVDEWISTLEIKVKVEPLDSTNLRRATQLFNKTNQLNLSTRRLTEAELMDWSGTPGRGVWTFRVADKFGDAGLTGIASLECEAGTAHIVDFILSCRVMGRKVEETMVSWLMQRAHAQGAGDLRATYIETAKNGMILEFWRRSGFDCADGMVFTRPVAKGYPQPAAVQLQP